MITIKLTNVEEANLRPAIELSTNEFFLDADDDLYLKVDEGAISFTVSKGEVIFYDNDRLIDEFFGLCKPVNVDMKITLEIQK